MRKEKEMIDDWMMVVFGLALLFFGILGYIIKTWRDLARLEGMMDSLRQDIRLLRDEGESLRIRLKELEKETKK